MTPMLYVSLESSREPIISGLALVEDGMPTFVLEEEQFNREKHTRKFPFGSFKAAFDDRGMDRSARRCDHHSMAHLIYVAHDVRCGPRWFSG